MTSYERMMPPDPKRFYRDVDNRIIGGVCGGIAEYFGFDRVLIRILFLGSFFFIGPFNVAGYILLWIIMPARPQGLFASEREMRFWQSVNARPVATVGDLARKFGDMERRLEQMERVVTSPEYSLDREFKGLGS